MKFGHSAATMIVPCWRRRQGRRGVSVIVVSRRGSHALRPRWRNRPSIETPAVMFDSLWKQLNVTVAVDFKSMDCCATKSLHICWMLKHVYVTLKYLTLRMRLVIKMIMITIITKT